MAKYTQHKFGVYYTTPGKSTPTTIRTEVNLNEANKILHDYTQAYPTYNFFMKRSESRYNQVHIMVN